LGNFELGGAERQALQLARYFKDFHYFDVQIVAFGKPAIISDICDQYGISWKSVRSPSSRFSFLRHLRLKKYGELLKNLQPYIIISYTSSPNVFTALTWKESGARLFIWNQRDVLVETLVETFDSPIEKNVIQNVPLFVTNSFNGKKFLIAKFNVNPTKIAVIRNSIQLKPPKWDKIQWRHNLGITNSTLLVSMVANLSQFKDHITLLQAWNILINLCKKEKKIEIMLVLAGRFDETYSSLVKLVKDLQIQEFVQFLGPVEDISGLLNSTDIGVLSSVSEGSPNSLLEYMAAGLPVVATDIPGIREIIPDSQIPFLFAPKDSTHFADLLMKLINDSNLRQKLGELNKQYVFDNFNPSNNNEQMRDLILNNPACRR
jgi:glycosyltransferase involved in cell wall biosynthesis